MNRYEKKMYKMITEGKAVSRRSIRKYTTGAERSSIKSAAKKAFYDNYILPPVVIPDLSKNI